LELDKSFMRRALELAKLGKGHVSPNPLVGCVIVHEEKIIGEGWHKEYGGPHAEVNAMNNVSDHKLLAQSTAYVSLEPCSHFGKTPPCADLLVESNLKRVVICNLDPNPEVSGNGIMKIQDHGIEVKQGVLENEGRELNRRFFTFYEKNRPYIILKWAQTADSFVAREDFSSKWISNSQSRKLVHKWRANEDAILVGRNTVLQDDPQLNVRDWDGINPTRVVIDPELKLKVDQHKIFDGSIPTIVYNIRKGENGSNPVYVQVKERKILLTEMLTDLYGRGICSLLVEGGANTLQSFINFELWDEARVFTSQIRFEKGVDAPKFKQEIEPRKSTKVADDVLDIYRNLEF